MVVDLGATRVRVAHGDESGLRGRLVEATDIKRGPQGITKQIIRMIRALGVEPSAIGIGSIGPLNLQKGSIINTPNIPFKNIPLAKPLADFFKVPVRMLNDCCAAVLGEQTYGAGRGLKNIVYVTFSTGLGGGAIVDDHLLLGKDGNAHEIGHLTIDPDSELVCGCGCRGHWEAYCSGANIPNYAKVLIGRKILEGGSKTGENLTVSTWKTAEDVFSDARRGDKFALLVVDKIGEINSIGFADIVNVYDPDLITVGGSVALNNPDMILEPIKRGIGEHVINRIPEIKITTLGEDAVLYGSLALAVNGPK